MSASRRIAAHGRAAQFDKRSYCGGQYAPGPRRLERIPEPPVWEEGLHLQVRGSRRACGARQRLTR